MMLMAVCEPDGGVVCAVMAMHVVVAVCVRGGEACKGTSVPTAARMEKHGVSFCWWHSVR